MYSSTELQTLLEFLTWLNRAFIVRYSELRNASPNSYQLKNYTFSHFRTFPVVLKTAIILNAYFRMNRIKSFKTRGTINVYGP